MVRISQLHRRDQGQTTQIDDESDVLLFVGAGPEVVRRERVAQAVVEDVLGPFCAVQGLFAHDSPLSAGQA